MAKPAEKLAQSLELLQALQEEGIVAIRAKHIGRTHRQRLLENGFIKEVMKGWYIPSRPDENEGESTTWYASFWSFCSAYLNNRFGDDWCLSPEQSLLIHAGNWTVPQQLLVRAPYKGSNKPVELLYGTSIYDVRTSIPDKKEIIEKEGLRLFSLPAALIHCAPGCFTQYPIDTRAVLSMVKDASDVLAQLLDGGHNRAAGRLAGAFRNIGRNRIADDIIKTMKAADYDVRGVDPFETKLSFTISSRENSPYVNRIRLMWEQMRESVIESFSAFKPQKIDIDGYLKQVEDIYVTDAYHSLSIEGYRVSRELIEKVRAGNWQPDTDETDREHLNALAARGYWQAFQAVKESIKKVLDGSNPGDVVKDAHGDWYREMFAPSVTAGILKPGDLAGYRNRPVYIRRSHHVPPNYEAVSELMPTLFELIKNEKSSDVRIVLAHFIFVFIHPYVDGNGRMGRFIMNVMFAAGGHPWLVIPVEERDNYMAVLEEASVKQNILPFAQFLNRLTGYA
ncbi:MAG: Fic family protein [Gammaproteobacteria bacterium]